MTHNKKRNTALILEFLKKTISESIINKDNVRAKVAYNIIKKYYSLTELREEKKLYDVVVNTFLSENIDDSAKLSIMEEAYSHYDRINKIKLDTIKSKLVKEINYKLGKDTYNIKLDNYRINALVNSLWNTRSRMERVKYLGVIKDEVEKIRSFNKGKVKLTEDVDPRVANKYVLNIIVEKYNERFKDLLPEQKEVLRTYMDFVFCKKNDDEFGKYLTELKTKLSRELQVIRENIKSTEVKHRIDDICTQINDMNDCPCKSGVDRTLKYLMETQEVISKWKVL